jgi:hypothetical protein
MSTTTIPPVNQGALLAFKAARQSIIEQVVLRSLQRPEEVEHHGDEAAELITSGIEFTTRMLENTMPTGQTTLLEDQLAWALDRLPHDGVAPEHLLSRFEIYAGVVAELMETEDAHQINRYLEWMINRLEAMIQGE